MPELPRRRAGRHQAAPTRLPAACLAVLALLAAAGCGVDAPREPYTNAFSSKEAAAAAVADALAARDADRLAALTITEVEFRQNVWPELPASQPEVGMPFEYLWADTAAKNRGYLAGVLHEYGGRRLTVGEVRFAGAPVDYGSFRIHPGTRLTVTDEDGATSAVRLFGSMLEAGGEWKIYSFVLD